MSVAKHRQNIYYTDEGLTLLFRIENHFDSFEITTQPASVIELPAVDFTLISDDMF